MVTKLENGKYYCWVGPQDFYSNWNSVMDEVKDGKPRKFIKEKSFNNRGYFEGSSINNNWGWSHVLDYFIEYKPNKQLELDFGD